MMPCDLAGLPPAAGAGATEIAPVPADAAARADLKTYLRLAPEGGGDGDGDDALLDRLIATAVGHGEALTGRLFVTRAVSEDRAALPRWARLACAPVRGIDAVALLAIDGGTAPLAATAYRLDIDGAGDGWLSFPGSVASGLGGADPAARVRVGYRAGIAAAWGGLPDPLRQGAIRLAAHLYSHRDAADEAAPPAAVAALWRPWRRMRLL